jgi:chemotaxis methyl-accepting protein methylase/chemotaxis receptor (MCP) glutamine deamidase CheD
MESLKHHDPMPGNLGNRHLRPPLTALKFEVVRSEIRDHHSVRIQQGEVHVGPEPQQTYLRSCVCVGFYHSTLHVGALSHLTGFSEDGGHGPRGALRELECGLGRYGVRLRDCECFVVGGTDAARHVYDSAIRELRHLGLPFRELDVLGAFHRKLLLNPADGRLELFKKSQSDSPEVAPVTPDPSLACFHDHGRRVITGASLLFRNEALLQYLRDTVIPSVLNSSARCHIWCAGCSTGMEVYSVGMVALDCLDQYSHGKFELRILGTDISEEALAQGRLGAYVLTRQAESRYASLVQRYCERIDAHTIRIGPELRSRVSFNQRDIRQGSHRHRFELVVCDHVLQYFTPEMQIEFLQGLRTGVGAGGFLFVSSPSNRIKEALLADGEYEMLGRNFFRRNWATPAVH